MKTLVSLLFVTACFAPAVDPGAPADARPGGGDGAAVDAASTACIQAATPPGDGHHNAGLHCLGCHTGAGAPRWTAAGTLYNAAGQPVAGATVTLVDSSGKSVAIVTAQNGNFWTTESMGTLARASASKCPSTVMMSSRPGGACNSCHTGSGTPGPINLP